MRKISKGSIAFLRKIISTVLTLSIIISLIPESAYASSKNSFDIINSSMNISSYSDEGFELTYKSLDTWNNYTNSEITIHNNTENDKSLWKVLFTYDGIIDNMETGRRQFTQTELS